MTALSDAQAHLRKAREFLDAAELSLDLDLFNAATSSAVTSGLGSTTTAIAPGQFRA